MTGKSCCRLVCRTLFVLPEIYECFKIEQKYHSSKVWGLWSNKVGIYPLNIEKVTSSQLIWMIREWDTVIREGKKNHYCPARGWIIHINVVLVFHDRIVVRCCMRIGMGCHCLFAQLNMISQLSVDVNWWKCGFTSAGLIDLVFFGNISWSCMSSLFSLK